MRVSFTSLFSALVLSNGKLHPPSFNKPLFKMRSINHFPRQCLYVSYEEIERKYCEDPPSWINLSTFKKMASIVDPHTPSRFTNCVFCWPIKAQRSRQKGVHQDRFWSYRNLRHARYKYPSCNIKCSPRLKKVLPLLVMISIKAEFVRLKMIVKFFHKRPNQLNRSMAIKAIWNIFVLYREFSACKLHIFPKVNRIIHFCILKKELTVQTPLSKKKGVFLY